MRVLWLAPISRHASSVIPLITADESGHGAQHKTTPATDDRTVSTGGIGRGDMCGISGADVMGLGGGDLQLLGCGPSLDCDSPVPLDQTGYFAAHNGRWAARRRYRGTPVSLPYRRIGRLGDRDTDGNGLIDRQRTLSNIGFTDHLSRLDNRRSLDRKLREYWELAQRGYPISALLIDIDRFKDINDQYGHDAGDILIRRFSDFLVRGVRNSDFVARLGGDEFCVVFPYESVDTAIDLARRLRHTIPQFTTINNGLKCPLGWTGGLAEIHPDDEGYRQVLGRADRAMLQAKAAGRNRTIAHTDASPLKLIA